MAQSMNSVALTENILFGISLYQKVYFLSSSLLEYLDEKFLKTVFKYFKNSNIMATAPTN